MKKASQYLINRFKIIRKIGDGGFSEVFLVLDEKSGDEKVVKILKDEFKTNRIENIIRFRNEAAVVSRLKHPHIVRIHETGEWEGTHFIVMDYVPGKSLHTMICEGQVFTIETILEIILQICTGLDYIHNVNVIHKDLKPSNIIIDQRADGIHVKLIDFGLAQVKDYMKMEEQAKISGTFHYLSPEQFIFPHRTGDERGDLYALGVLFYQLVANRLPFTAGSIDSLIHQQLAKKPVTPSKINKEFPESLDRIILKLLEKEPANRYQSAAGLAWDLRQYTLGKEDIEPGKNDIPKRLSFKSVCIGRRKDLDKLKEYYGNAINGRSSICLISGNAGVGKTRLVMEFRHYVFLKAGVFIQGLCFLTKKREPYGPFKDALNHYLQVFGKYSNKKKDMIKAEIKETVKDMGMIIIQLCPGMAELIPDPPPLVKLEPDREQNRFVMLISRFFIALSRLENGMVLFIDDLQWADEGSIILLKCLIEDTTSSNLFILGNYREEEIDEKTGFLQYAGSVEESGNPFSIHRIKLKNLDISQHSRFIKSLLHSTGEKVKEIEEAVWAKSKGNPLYTIEIVKQLVKEKGIYCKENQWMIDGKKLNQIEISQTMLEALLKRISVLDEISLAVLSYAAVIGKEFELDLLIAICRAFILELTDECIITIIDMAGKQQFVEYDPYKRGRICFVHDRIRTAFYEKISESERLKLHHDIAGTIEKINCFPESQEDRIYLLAYHYIEAGDREKIIEYAYRAGLKAMESYAITEAINYFAVTEQILKEMKQTGSSKWLVCREKMGEIYMMTGELDKAIIIFQDLLPCMETNLMKAEVYKKICRTYLKMGFYRESEKAAKKGMSLLGENLPISNGSVFICLVIELCRYLLYTFIFEVFPLKDIKRYRKTTFLIGWFYYTLAWNYGTWNFLKCAYSIIRACNISLGKIGDSRTLGITYLGQGILYAIFGNNRIALKKGNRGRQILQNINDRWGVAKANEMLGMVWYYKNNLKNTLYFFEKAITQFEIIGDLSELHSIYDILAIYFHSHSNYEKAITYANMLYNYCKQIKYEPFFFRSIMYLVLLYKEQGQFEKAREYFQISKKINIKKKEFWYACKANIEFASLLLETKEYKKAILYFKTAKQQLGKQQNVEKVVEFFTAYTAKMVISKNTYYSQIYPSLAEAYIAELTSSGQYTKNDLKKIKKLCFTALKKTKIWILYHGHSLRVVAMYYALADKPKKAGHFFLKSISQWKKLGRKYELARSYYHYGLFLDKTGKPEKAREILVEAYAIFKTIGSEHYQKEIEELPGITTSIKTTIGAQRMLSTDQPELPINQIKKKQRLSSIIRVNQELNSILELDQLLKRILAIALEVTGAQRGFLFKQEHGELQLFVCQDMENNAPVTEGMTKNYSQTIVNKVYREGNVILTTNAVEDNRFKDLASVIAYDLKSILCIPIKYKDKISGICYLDNPLSISIFTEDDITLLNAIMIQAAVCIENAMLYEKMKQLKNKTETEVEILTEQLSVKSMKHRINDRYTLIYKSPAMHDLLCKVKEAHNFPYPVLITGETGTGKELIARILHGDKTKPFVAVNCPSVPETLWESELFGHVKGAFTDAKTSRMGYLEGAGDGTLFFDEIGEIPLDIQAKLLRLIQEKRYRKVGSEKLLTARCRFIFATNRDLDEMISRGLFRSDLYYRINVFHIHIPPLRERKEDISLLFSYFLNKYKDECDISVLSLEQGVIDTLNEYLWPGNVRELENLSIGILAMVKSRTNKKEVVINNSHLPENFLYEVKNQDTTEKEHRINRNYHKLVDDYSKQLIGWALKNSKGNKTRAAELLGIKRTTLNYKLKELERT